MLNLFSENPYLVSLSAGIIGIVLFYIYIKFLKKEEPNKNDFVKIFLVIFIFCIGSFYIKGDIKMSVKKSGGKMEDLISIGDPGF